MDDPSQHSRQIESSEIARREAKLHRQLTKSGSRGLGLSNNKWDVEYEGKDAKGTLERPFLPGWGDSRSLPKKFLGETTAQAVARGMGRGLIEGGITHNKSHSIDGKDDKYEAGDDAKLREMRLASQEAHAPPDLRRSKRSASKSQRQQERLEAQWAVGLTGGSYGMHTMHVTTPPPAFKSKTAARKVPPAPIMGVTPEPGPPSPTKSPKSPDSRRKGASKSSRRSSPSSLASPSPSKARNTPEAFDRMGPNHASGPIPRDGFVSDAYEEYASAMIAEMNGPPSPTGKEPEPSSGLSLW